MIHLLIICMIIVGFMILGGGAALVFSAADRYNGYRALRESSSVLFSHTLSSLAWFTLSESTTICHPLPWEFANTTLMSSL